MSKNQDRGKQGEIEVCELVKCPNCSGELFRLPQNYPLFDVQCSACSFRAQIKTSFSKPKKEIFGAGWDVIDKVVKSGFQIPNLIVNFIWNDGREIRFYPFIPRVNLKKRTLSSTAKRANYRMFNYIGLDKLPYFVLYKKRI